MAENIITNANDVELVMTADGTNKGTPQSMGRIVVDDFTLTRSEDVQSVSGVGFQLPAGLSNGDIELEYSFTMMGEDADVFDMVATADGHSRIFSFTARKMEDGEIQWSYTFDTCKAASEEISGTSGDPMEYAVEGFAVSYDRNGTLFS